MVILRTSRILEYRLSWPATLQCQISLVPPVTGDLQLQVHGHASWQRQQHNWRVSGARRVTGPGSCKMPVLARHVGAPCPSSHPALRVAISVLNGKLLLAWQSMLESTLKSISGASSTTQAQLNSHCVLQWPRQKSHLSSH